MKTTPAAPVRLSDLARLKAEGEADRAAGTLFQGEPSLDRATENEAHTIRCPICRIPVASTYLCASCQGGVLPRHVP